MTWETWEISQPFRSFLLFSGVQINFQLDEKMIIKERPFLKSDYVDMLKVNFIRISLGII